jgi:hypothetical protein
MPIYTVEVQELWIRSVTIEADNPDLACELVHKGTGDIIRESLDLGYSTHPDTWMVREDNEQT